MEGADLTSVTSRNMRVNPNYDIIVLTFCCFQSKCFSWISFFFLLSDVKLWLDHDYVSYYCFSLPFCFLAVMSFHTERREAFWKQDEGIIRTRQRDRNRVNPRVPPPASSLSSLHHFKSGNVNWTSLMADVSCFLQDVWSFNSSPFWTVTSSWSRFCGGTSVFRRPLNLVKSWYWKFQIKIWY